jgi:Flp pilus assembly protein TadD
MGRFDKAIAHLERAATLLDTDWVIFDHLGDAYFKRRDWERARRNWERALALEPDEAVAIAIQQKLDQLMSQQPVTTTPP